MSDNDAPIDDRSALQVVGLSPDGLDAIGLPELRRARDGAVATETGVSYLRRLVQAPLDTVRGELEQRAAGRTSDLAALVDDLPRVLSEHSGGGGGRMPRTLEPTEVDPELAAELDAIIQGGMRIAMLPTASDDELVEMAGSLDDARAQGVAQASPAPPHHRSAQRRAGSALRHRRAHTRGCPRRRRPRLRRLNRPVNRPGCRRARGARSVVGP